MQGEPPASAKGASAQPEPALAVPFFVRWDAQRDPLQAVRPADPELHGAAVELVRAAAGPDLGAAVELAGATAGPDSDEGAAAPRDHGTGGAEPPAKPPTAERPAIDREADLLAQRILALRDEGQRLGDIVVLLRRFTHLTRYTLALKRAGIAHYVVRGRGFYQAQEVLDVAALLTLLADPDDRLALLTLLRSPLCGLSDDSLLRLHQDGRLTLVALLQGRRGAAARSASGQDRDSLSGANHSSASASGPADDSAADPREDLSEELFSDSLDDELSPPLELLGEARTAAPPSGLPADEAARLARLLLLMQVLLRLGDRIGPAACLQLTYDHTDLLAVLAADPDGEQRVANLLRLQERARGFDKSGGLRRFVRALRLATDPQLKAALQSPGDEPAAQIAGEADDVVRIMTVHQAKGLEFPVVLVAGCTTRERTDSPAVAYDRAVGLGLTIYQEGERVRTLAARRVDANARLRASAESARLFYVAATRARERLIFLGETGRRPRVAGTWRAHLDALLAAQDERHDPRDSDAAPLLAEWRPGPPRPPHAAPSPVSSEALLRAARQAAALVYQDPLGTPRPALPDSTSAPLLQTAVAADLLVCARRFHLRTTARLCPGGPAARPALSDEAGGESAHAQLRSGSLAGQLLAKADPKGGGAELESLLLIAGVDPADPRALELQTHVRRFLDGQTRRGSALGALLVAAPGTTVQRAVPYLLTTAQGAMRLGGVLDLLHLKHSAAGLVVTVIDYQYSSAPEAEGPLHLQRRALLALVASRLYPDATELRTGLCFLREADAEPVLQTADRAELIPTAAALALVAPYTKLTLQAALRLPVLPVNTCAALGCEYQPLCHARS